MHLNLVEDIGCKRLIGNKTMLAILALTLYISHVVDPKKIIFSACILNSLQNCFFTFGVVFTFSYSPYHSAQYTDVRQILLCEIALQIHGHPSTT